MIGIINYGSGNIQAITNIYDRSKVVYRVISNPLDIDSDINKLILPGVGSFDQTMYTLLNSGFKSTLDELVLSKNMNVLGICVGMQILADGSDEGKLPGLGWIKGRVRQFDPSLIKNKPKIPHLGWNSIKITRNSPLFDSIDVNQGFYFLHSYYFDCYDNNDSLTTTFYSKDFTSSVNKYNIYGTQFHPEKSHSNGIKLLLNYANL